MKAPASILFGFAWTVLTSYAFGRWILLRLGLQFAREEERWLAFVAGSAALSMVVFLLGFLRLLYDPVFLAVGAAAILLAWRSGSFRSHQEPLPPLPRGWKILLLCGAVPFGVVGFLHAMAPEMSPDGSSYHLGIPALYYRARAIVPVTSTLYAHLSQGAEMLYLYAFAFGRHSSAALVHFSFLVALAGLMVAWGKRRGKPAAGVCGALFTLMSPVVLVDAASAYNDVAVACVCFAVFTLCELAPARPGWRFALLLGSLAGFCYALKYTAILAAPFALYSLLRAAKQERLRLFLVFSSASAFMALPWALKNWAFTGNPLAPFFNHWFPNGFVHRSFEVEFAESMRRYVGLESYADLPLELTVRGQVLGGFLGPLFLLAPLALLALRTAEGRRLLAAGVLFSLPFAANIGTRFLIPGLPFFSLALALAVPWPALPLLAAAHGVLSFPDIPAAYCREHAWRISTIPLQQALRIEPQDQYLERKFPGYKVVRMVERFTPKGAVVYSFSPLPDSYVNREVWTSYQSAEGEVLRDSVLMQFISDYPPVERLQFRFPEQELEAVRAVQGAPPSKEQWSLNEFHVLRGGQRLMRSPQWRIRAWPNNRDVAYIFDNAPLPRWRSWHHIEPGMYVELKFGRPARLDEVHLDVSTDQRAAKVRVEGRAPGGAWTLLSPEPVTTGLPVPLGMRRLAMEEMKKRGIGFLLVQPGDYMESDFVENISLWGLRQVGEVDGARLFRIE